MNDRNLKPGWTRVAFGDVVWQVKDRVEPATSGLKRYVAGDHMDTGDLHIRRWGEIGDGYLGPAFHMRFRPGQVLYGSRRTYLRKVAVADFEGITANTTFVLESKDSNVLLPNLLPFVMSTESFHKYSIEKSKGSVNPYVNFSDLATYEFVLPPLDEQRRIALLLCASESILQSWRSVLRTCARVMHAVIDRFENENRRKSIGTLGEIIDRIESGRSVAGLGKQAERGEHGVLKVSAVGDWQFRESENKKVPSHYFDESLKVSAGDILVIRANANPRAIGRSCIVSEITSPTLMLSDKTWRLILKKNIEIDRFGVLAWMKSGRFRRHILNQAGGTDAKNISKKRFLTAPFPCRAGSHFMDFAATVRQVAGSRGAAEVRYKQAEHFNHGLVAKAFLLDSFDPSISAPGQSASTE